ncbi:MAG: radical SAM protein [Bacteroidales bacterium]|nr:radical SAM protein [Bacteroidales bacterium]
MQIEKRYLSLPLTAQLEVTDCCNHRCVHCYNLDSEIQNRPMRHVDDETVLKCAQKLIDNKVFGVIVTGGEPLINKELTKQVITLLKGNQIRVSLNSNLTLFDDDFIAFLKEKKVGVLTSCPSGFPSSFAKLVGIDNYVWFEANLKKLVAAGVRCTVNMVVTKENLYEIRTTAEKMKALGCRSFAATPMGLNVEYPRLDLLLTIEEVRQVIADLLWIEKELGMKVDVLEALPKCVFPEAVLMEKHAFLNRKCQAGRTVVAVSCNGDVRPCAHNPFSYGNLLEEDLRDIWQKMSDWRSAQYVPEPCLDCAWLNRCNGGCRTSAKAFNGDWNKNDMWCTGKLAVSPPSNDCPSIELKPDTRLQFTDGQTDKEKTKGQIVDYLLGKGYKVVAKEHLEKLYKEQQGQQSGIYNAETTVEGNNFTAVGYFISARITEEYIQVQVVNVSTGEFEGNVTINL